MLGEEPNCVGRLIVLRQSEDYLCHTAKDWGWVSRGQGMRAPALLLCLLRCSREQFDQLGHVLLYSESSTTHCNTAGNLHHTPQHT